MSRAVWIAKQYSIAVLREVRGAESVEQGLVSQAVRDAAQAEEQEVLWVELAISFYGSMPADFSRPSFSLEDSEGYLVRADDVDGVLDVQLQPGASATGALVFSIYHDVAPMRLWFDTGLPFDESGAPLMLEIALAAPLPGAPAPAVEESWREGATRNLDRQSSRIPLPPADAPGLDVEQMMRQLSEMLDLPFKRLANGYSFRVQLAGNRRQSVLMGFGGQDDEGAALIRFVTICAPADDQGANHRVFLQANPRLSYGAIGITLIDGVEFYVMTQTQLVETADPEELIKSISYLARKGDELESQLTGGADIR